MNTKPTPEMIITVSRIRELSDADGAYEQIIDLRKRAATIIARDLVSPLLGETWRPMLPPKPSPAGAFISEQRIKLVIPHSRDHVMWFKRDGRKAEDYVIASMPYLAAIKGAPDAAMREPDQYAHDHQPAMPMGEAWGAVRCDDGWSLWNPGRCAFLLFGAAVAPIAAQALEDVYTSTLKPLTPSAQQGVPSHA